MSSEMHGQPYEEAMYTLFTLSQVRAEGVQRHPAPSLIHLGFRASQHKVIKDHLKHLDLLLTPFDRTPLETETPRQLKP